MHRVIGHFNTATAQRMGRLLAGLVQTAHTVFEGGPPGRAERAAPASAALPSANAEPWHVLLADDNPAHLEQAFELLEQQGAVTLRAGDGAEAVAIARAHEFDLILMNLRMPILGGLAAAQQIRAHERGRAGGRVPVMAYTAASPATAVLRHNGLDGTLSKPCNATALEACLRQRCARPGPDAQGQALAGIRR